MIKSGAALLGAAFLLLSGSPLEAQELPGGIVRLIETQCEDGGGDPEALAEYFMELIRRPLDLSTADREALEAFPLLTPFMVVSLLEYRREFGPVASAGELALVDGFDAAAVEEILPFVTFGAGTGAGGLPEEGRMPLRFSGRLTLRTRYLLEREGEEADGLPVPLYARYRMELGEHFSAGATLESDRGERDFPDFYSVHSVRRTCLSPGTAAGGWCRPSSGTIPSVSGRGWCCGTPSPSPDCPLPRPRSGGRRGCAPIPLRTRTAISTERVRQ